MSEYILHLAVMIGIYLLLAQSFNIVLGFANLLNLSHISFYALGAYSTALLSSAENGWPWSLSLLAGMALSALLSCLVGGISLRLSTDYFAIGTLACSAAVSAILVNWRSLTRGVLGIAGIERPTLWGYTFESTADFLCLVIAINCIVLGGLFALFKSPFARSLRAQSEAPLAAMALGKNIQGIRLTAFVISASIASLAGSLYASYITYIDPNSFSLAEMIFVLSIVIVGRPGSFWGVIAATFFLVLLPEPLRQIDFSPDVLGPLRQLIHSVILFSIIWVYRERIFPIKRSV